MSIETVIIVTLTIRVVLYLGVALACVHRGAYWVSALALGLLGYVAVSGQQAFVTHSVNESILSVPLALTLSYALWQLAEWHVELARLKRLLRRATDLTISED